MTISIRRSFVEGLLTIALLMGPVRICQNEDGGRIECIDIPAGESVDYSQERGIAWPKMPEKKAGPDDTRPTGHEPPGPSRE